MFEAWAKKMVEATSAKERTAIVQEVARLAGVSVDKAYRILQSHGWSSGRKRRGDVGGTNQDELALKFLAALLVEGVRKNGKATMTVPQARSILEANGFRFTVGDSRIRELLRRANLDSKSLAKPEPAQYMRSLHPNHVHMVDPSLALIYYAPDGSQYVIHDDEAYKNKPEFMKGKEHLRCWRYVLTDHYSGTICARYYQADGENMVNLFDFLLFAWARKSDPMYHFHGLPKMLILDPGSANISKPMVRALTSLKVNANPHLPGNPRAKGSVEGANNLVELGLESRLRLEPVNSVAELNVLADNWCAAFNANQIKGKDCQLVRNGMRLGSRLGLWDRITTEQLKELPDPAICRLLLSYEPVVRTLDGHLSFSYDHPKAGRQLYSMYGQPGLLVGSEVTVQPILIEAEAVMKVTWINGLDEITTEVKPMERDSAGFSMIGAVYGEEYKSPKETVAGTNKKELKKLAYGTTEPKRNARPFADFNDGEGLKAHSFIKTDGWDAMDIKPAPKVGTPVEVTSADVVRPEQMIHTATEAMIKIKARVSPEPMPEGYMKWLKATYPNGVTSTEIEVLVSDLLPRTDLTFQPNAALKEARHA